MTPRAGCRCCLDRRRLILGAAATLTLPGCDRLSAQIDLPRWLLDLLVPESVAAELGAATFRDALRQHPPARDAGVQRRVAAIGERLVRASGSPWPNWQFVVLEADAANAFALPGGYVGVLTGMLRVAEDDAQLAAVLGHEVGHVNARHAAERLVAGNAVALALRLGVGLFGLGDGQLPPELLGALGSAAAEFGVIRPFGRGQELEADELGLRYMATAGFDPAAALAFWQRMMALQGPDRSPAFLSTHPAGEQRLERLRALLPEVAR